MSGVTEKYIHTMCKEIFFDPDNEGYVTYSSVFEALKKMYSKGHLDGFLKLGDMKTPSEIKPKKEKSG